MYGNIKFGRQITNIPTYRVPNVCESEVTK